MDTVNTMPDYPRGITFEQVWAALERTDAIVERNARRVEETDRQMQETDRLIKETDRMMKETARRMMKETARRMEETDRRMQETDRQIQETARRMEETDRQMKETDRQMKETDRQIQQSNKRFNEFSNRFGEILEHMVMPNLVDKFEELGFTFTKANRTEVKDKEHDLFFEVDALLENGDKVMAVEIKSKPNTDDVNYHLERMEKLRQYADLHNDHRIYFGAMAGAVFNDSVKIYSLKHGLYVIEPSGETFKITMPEGKYHPHEW